MTLRIAPAGARDRERVAEIVAATGVFRAAEAAVALEVFDSAVECPGVDYFALGAFDDFGRLVGFACYGPTPCTVGTWDLYWIAVDPAFQRQGTGRALMEECERSIARRGGRLVVVETSSRPDYRPTRDFYRKLGYRETARIPDFYAPDDDLLVYVKHLTPSGRDRVHG